MNTTRITKFKILPRSHSESADGSPTRSRNGSADCPAPDLTRSHIQSANGSLERVKKKSAWGDKKNECGAVYIETYHVRRFTVRTGHSSGSVRRFIMQTGWRPVRIFTVRTWQNLKSDFMGGIHLILIFESGN